MDLSWPTVGLMVTFMAGIWLLAMGSAYCLVDREHRCLVADTQPFIILKDKNQSYICHQFSYPYHYGDPLNCVPQTGGWMTEHGG